MNEGEITELMMAMRGTWEVFASAEELVLGWTPTLGQLEAEPARKAMALLQREDEKRPSVARFMTAYKLVVRRQKEREDRQLGAGPEDVMPTAEEARSAYQSAAAQEARRRMREATGPLFDGEVIGDAEGR